MSWAIDSSVCHPVLVYLGEHRAEHACERSSGREDLHHAAAALELAIGLSLHAVGAQAFVVGMGEVEVCQGIGLCLLQESSCLRAEVSYLLVCQVA